MGLDMYLKKGKRIKRKSVKKIMEIENEIYYGDNEELLNQYKDYVITKKYEWDDKPRYVLTEEACYWRKANQIHKWFVDNVQNGVDDCDNYEVTKEHVEELLRVCKEVLEKSILKESKIENGKKLENGKWVPILEDGQIIANPEIAESLLPTASGFFFGNTNYNSWYIEDLKHTIEEFEKILENTDFENEFLVYHSSW